MTTIYDYHKFVHRTPSGCTIPKDTQIRLVNLASKHTEETFFTTLDDLTTPDWEEMEYYLDHDITKPKLPTEINSVIYNVKVNGRQFPLAVRRNKVWSVFSDRGVMIAFQDHEIESFDTTPASEKVEP